MGLLNTAMNKLKDRGGASLVLVLAVMLCLLLISVSVLSAATSNAVHIKNQREHYGLLLLDDSIQRNIMYSLQKDTMDETLLSYQLVMALFEAEGGLSDIKLDSVISGLDLDCVITLSFPDQMVNVRPGMPEIPGVPEIPGTPERVDDEGNVIPASPGSPGIPHVPRVPATATVGTRMTATVVADIGGRALTSIATYQYVGGELSDEAMEGNMRLVSGGKWSLIKYEKADTRN